MVALAVLMFGLAVLCLVVAAKPRAAWRLTAAWQFKDPERVDLRDEIYVLHSVSAAVSAVILVGTGIWLLQMPVDEMECERIMSELEDAAAGVDFDTSDISEVADDFDARWDFDRTASNLGVELVEHGSSVEVVAEDGEVLGTINEYGVDSRCD
jgi:hypothetical protein